MEFFKLISGFPGYLITEYGKVWSKQTSKFLKPYTNNRGYLAVSLGTEKKKRQVHRLVAEAWLPNPDNLPVVHHKDSDTLNNHYTNLEWCTQQYNVRQGKAAKLTEEDVAEIKRLYDTGWYAQWEIGDMFGVTQSMVSLITKR